MKRDVPMKWKVIKKSELPVLIEEIVKDYEVYTPVKEGNIVSFKMVSSGNEVHLDFWNTKKPPKEIFLPQNETLFTYRNRKKDVELVEATTVGGNKVLLGVRPCDARSFVLLDKFFSSGEHKDSLYFERRKDTVIFGLACNRPRSTCFCTSVGGSPSGKEGMDLLFQEINGKYLIEEVTRKGEKIIKKIAWLKDAEKADIEKAKEFSKVLENAVKSKVSITNMDEKLDIMFDDSLWDGIQQKCVGCGVCTFLCPTCCCFDILDDEAEGGRRVRIWDSCQFPLFTLEASGHNPRPSGKERIRQRIMHKFNYSVKNFDQIFCVGCGRCVQECPVNLDIREIVDEISTRQVE